MKCLPLGFLFYVVLCLGLPQDMAQNLPNRRGYWISAARGRDGAGPGDEDSPEASSPASKSAPTHSSARSRVRSTGAWRCLGRHQLQRDSALTGFFRSSPTGGCGRPTNVVNVVNLPPVVHQGGWRENTSPCGVFFSAADDTAAGPAHSTRK